MLLGCCNQQGACKVLCGRRAAAGQTPASCSGACASEMFMHALAPNMCGCALGGCHLL
jgi:hypothetical protein